MNTVFDVFTLTDYDFLQVVRGGIAGNMIEAVTSATGVFKHRSQLQTGANSEEKASTATLHVKPDEPFVASNNGSLIGHGIRINQQDYVITGQTGGRNYDSGELEHITCTLQESDYSDFVEGS